jgi:two-component sensor histidine kinase
MLLEEKSMMSSSGNGKSPVVEPAEGTPPDRALRELQQRIKQQEILAELGVSALQGASLDELLASAARLVADGLRTEFCKILEYLPDEHCFIVRAGAGWGPGVVGVARIGADLESPAGFALRTGTPVISNHLDHEQRFRTPELLQRHGVRRAMNVIVRGDGKPFGVLEVDSRSEDEFSEHDLAFLQGAANILGMAIERERREESLKAALERQRLLLREMNHRVKNSVTLVASMLHLQSSSVGDPALTAHLGEASNRVRAIARVHDQLSAGDAIESLDLGSYLEAVCQDLQESVAGSKIHIDVQKGIEIETGRAVSAALIVNELITNSLKYAYKDQPGEIWVTLRLAGENDISISVRDEGAGLPEGYDPQTAKTLGTRIIRFLVQQLKGSLAAQRRDPGTEFIITLPLKFEA